MTTAIACPNCNHSFVPEQSGGRRQTIWISSMAHDALKIQSKVECLSVSHLIRKAIDEVPDDLRLEVTSGGNKTISIHLVDYSYERLQTLAKRDCMGTSTALRAIVLWYLGAHSTSF